MARDIFGTNSSETLNGSSVADNIYGRGGDDDLYGNGGNDRLDGGTGDDYLYGGSGNDILIGGDGINDLWGDSGRDWITVSARAGAGLSDDLVWDFTFDEDRIDLRAWGVSDFSQVQALLETDQYGDATLNAYYAGTDHVLRLDGIDPDDLLAEDFLFANPAAIEANGTTQDDVLFGSRSGDTLRGLAGHDILLGGYGNDVLVGGAGNDRLVGGGGNDSMAGGNDSDLLEGGAGADRLSGDAGRDFLYGDAGNDILRGGAGTDDLEGGAGADRFVFDDGDFGGTTAGTADLILDFSHAERDRIDLSQVDAVTGGGDNAFAFIGSSNFSGVAGQLRAYASGGDTFVQGDQNGDGTADFLIVLEGTHSLVAGDFVL